MNIIRRRRWIRICLTNLPEDPPVPYSSKEATRFPDDLFQSAPIPSDSTFRWRVLHTRPRQEKSLARELAHRRIQFYLPLISQRRRIRSRVIDAYFPLFPGYLPILGSSEERVAAQETRRVAQVLEVPNQFDFWGELRQIERLIASGLPITREDRLASGDRVRIRNGPLAGLVGTVLRTEGKSRFLVKVDFIQRGASVLAEDFDLMALN